MEPTSIHLISGINHTHDHRATRTAKTTTGCFMLTPPWSGVFICNQTENQVWLMSVLTLAKKKRKVFLQNLMTRLLHHHFCWLKSDVPLSSHTPRRQIWTAGVLPGNIFMMQSDFLNGVKCHMLCSWSWDGRSPRAESKQPSTFLH